MTAPIELPTLEALPPRPTGTRERYSVTDAVRPVPSAPLDPRDAD